MSEISCDIAEKVKKLKSFKRVAAFFINHRMRLIDHFIRFEHDNVTYLANTYFLHNVIKVFEHESLSVLDLFPVSINFGSFLRNIQTAFSLNLGRSNIRTAQKADELFTFVSLLLEQKFIVREQFNELTQLKKYRAKAQRQVGEPRTIIIATSMQCNLSCPGCCVFVPGKHNQIPAMMTMKVFDRQFKFFLKTISKDNTSDFVIKFYGGEPLLNIPFIERAAKKIRRYEEQGVFGDSKVDLVLTTNGTLIDEHVAQLIRNYKMIVGVSLDGVGKSNDAQRIFHGGKGTFEAIINGINLLKKYEIPYSLSWTIGPKNINMVVKDLVWIAEHLDKPPLVFNIMQGVGTKGDPFKKLSDKQFFDKMHAIYDQVKALGMHEQRITYYRRWAQNRATPYHFYCLAVSSGQFVFRPDGKIGICNHTIQGGDEDHYRFPKDIEKLLKLDAYPDWKGRSPLFMKDCYQSCSYFTFCPGGCAKRALEVNDEIFSTVNENCRAERFYVERGILEAIE